MPEYVYIIHMTRAYAKGNNSVKNYQIRADSLGIHKII